MPTCHPGFRVIMLLLVLAALPLSPMASVRAQSSGTSHCSAPAGSRCTLTFTLNDGESVSGNFTSDGFVRLFVTDPGGTVVFDTGAVVISDNFEIAANSTGNYAFIFDNHLGQDTANVTLNYIHHVSSGGGIGGEFSIPEFPIQPVMAAALTLLIVISYVLARRPIRR